MKKYIVMLTSLLICFILLFYLSFNINLDFNIIHAKQIYSPLEGTWTAAKYFRLDSCSLSDEQAKALLNSTIVFSKDTIHINNTNYANLNYKVKLVDSKAYLWDNYRIKASDIDIKSNTIKIYTVSSHNSFFDEFIEIDDNFIAKANNDVLILYSKLGSSANAEKNDLSMPSKIILSKAQKDIISETGLILGIRCKNNNGYSYKTFFIGKEYNSFSKIIEVNSLIIPRKNGFWKMMIDNNSNETSIIEYPLMKYSDTPLNLRKIQSLSPPANSFVNFVDNDYVFIDNAAAYFSVLPLDDINSSSIAFSKILGLNAKNYLRKSAKSFLTQKERKIIPEPNVESLDTNWSIIRRTGKWILRGRLPNGDFDVSFQIPNVLTAYDDLYIPFNVIKQKYPDAVDAYASINKDFLVVLTKSKLLILPTTNKTINSPILSLNIDDNETSIMAQWATGSYVSAWQKLFTALSK